MGIYSPDTERLAGLWGKHYQTERDPDAMADWQLRFHMGGPQEDQIQESVDAILGGYIGELKQLGLDRQDFRNLLIGTAYKESEGGKYDTQQGGGPARGYFQVEPDTARDLITAYDMENGKLVNPRISHQYWGKGMEKATGYSAEQLYNLNNEELGEVLRTNPTVGAGMAGGKFMKSMFNELAQSKE